MLSNVLPLHLKQTFPPILWIFTESGGDEIKSRLPYKIYSTLLSIKYQDIKTTRSKAIVYLLSRFDPWFHCWEVVCVEVKTALDKSISTVITHCANAINFLASSLAPQTVQRRRGVLAWRGAAPSVEIEIIWWNSLKVRSVPCRDMCWKISRDKPQRHCITAHLSEQLTRFAAGGVWFNITATISVVLTINKHHNRLKPLKKISDRLFRFYCSTSNISNLFSTNFFFLFLPSQFINAVLAKHLHT